MNAKTKKVTILVTIAALAAVAVTSVWVFAQSTASGSSTAQSASSATSTTFLAKVAKNLGIEESALEAAIRTAREQSIDEALAAGRITQEQATAMKERLTARKAMDELIAEGVASGKITQEQADLAGARGFGALGRSMMKAERFGAGSDESCGGRMGRGTGIGR